MGIDYQLALAIKRHAKDGHALMLGRLNWCVRDADARKLHVNKLPLYRDYSESFFHGLGMRVDSMDVCSAEAPTIVHDLNFPVPHDLNAKYDLIVDGGTLEHVYDIVQAIRNVKRMLKPDGVFIGQVPVNGYAAHGCHQLQPEFWNLSFPQKILEMKLLVSGCRPIDIPNDEKRRIARREFTTVRAANLLVVAQNTDSQGLIQRDYQEMLDTGIVPAWPRTKRFRRFVLERIPASQWIYSWIELFRRLRSV